MLRTKAVTELCYWRMQQGQAPRSQECLAAHVQQRKVAPPCMHDAIFNMATHF